MLRVPDMAKALGFYCGVLGAVEERRIDKIGLVQLRVGKSLIDLIDLAKWMKEPRLSPEAFNVDHICLRIEPFEEAQITRYLTAKAFARRRAARRYASSATRSSRASSRPRRIGA